MELKKTILELFPGKHLGTLTIGIEEALAKSFDKEKMRNPTHLAVKERFDKCINWALVLRGDLGWGTHRIIQALPYMLSTELNGGTWTPSDRQIWVQADGS